MEQNVGREVKRLRERRGWSQAKLAVEAEMSVSGVSMIENGQRNLTTTTLGKLAAALGVEVADLFPKAETPLPFEEEVEQRRNPYADAWTAYMHRRAREWEEALPHSIREAPGKLRDPREMSTELLGNPRLALEILSRNELVQAEATTLLDAICEPMEAGAFVPSRPGMKEFFEALMRVDIAAEGWQIIADLARNAVGNLTEFRGEIKRAREGVERAERAAEARRNVVPLFRKIRSA